MQIQLSWILSAALIVGAFQTCIVAAADLGDLQIDVLTEERESHRRMVAADIERRRLLAIQRENAAWARVTSRETWERFRDQRIEALRASLGGLPRPSHPPRVETTARIEGDGFRIENLVIETRPGLIATANLYLPSDPDKDAKRPAILISHSHHAPKTQGELQDMGMTWARSGCVVLVMDHLGHGERRQHPFVRSSDYPRRFRVSRQDYYFRYNIGLQLQLVGESQVGWMAADLMRGVDLLCAREDVDENRIILIGAVAGGGDPAGVTAALDERIAAVAPFNFGGPQPDYAIPEKAEDEFYFFGVAYWETTRCLRLGGRDGFAHWTIVGSVAPRRLIYSFEFAWDRQHDPVWPRLQRVFGFYNASDHLDVAEGRGELRGRPPESTHCGNVGAYHRAKFYPHLERWFGMKPPPKEYQQRRATSELMCLTAEVKTKLQSKPVYELAAEIGGDRLKAARAKRKALDHSNRRRMLRSDWARLLGDIEPKLPPQVVRTSAAVENELAVERTLLRLEEGIVAPVVFLRNKDRKSPPSLTVVMLARSGKQRLSRARSAEIATLIEGGAEVCLPDLRGFGETRSGDSVGRGSSNTTLSCRDQVLGRTQLGSRLHDLRSVLQYVRRRGCERIAIWGDSLVQPNPTRQSEVVPYGVENPNAYAHPSGALLAIMAALYEEDVEAVYANGGLASFNSLLQSPFLYVPHDAVVPGALTVSEIDDVINAVAPRPVRLGNVVNGLNRRVQSEKTTSPKAAVAWLLK